MPERTITVRGYGVASVKPDGVRLRLTVRRVAQSPDAALDEATERSHVLERMFEELGLEPSAWTTDVVALAEERRWDDKQQRDVRTGHSATAGLVVLLKDLSQAGPLMKEATGRAEAQIAGPWWHVAPENEAIGEACRQAVEDAKRRAEAVATGLGSTVGPVRSVKEPAPHDDGYHPTAGFVGLSSSASAEMNLQPGGLEVGVSIEVTFELT